MTRPTYEIVFEDVKSFLQEYRANLQRDRMWIPLADELRQQDQLTLRLKPPFFKQKIVIDATVLARRSDGYDVAVHDLTPRNRATLEAYSGLCESIWEECMRHLVEQVGGTLRPGRGLMSSETGGADSSSGAPSPAVPIPPSMASGPAQAEEPASAEVAAPYGEDDPPPAGAEGDSNAGALDKIPLARTLSRLALAQASGRLKVDTDDEHAELTLYRGWLVGVKAPSVEERTRLGDILVKTGVIDDRLRSMAMEQAKEKGLSLGQALLRSRKISGRSLKRALERQLRARLVAISRYRKGTFRFETEALDADPDHPPVNPVRVFYERWVRDFTKRTPMEVQQAERQVSGLVQPRHPGTDDLSVLTLGADERELWDLIRGEARTLDALYIASPISRRQTHAVIFALKELGVVEFRETA